MLNFRDSSLPTHTVDIQGDFTEAFLLAYSGNNIPVWLTETLEIYVQEMKNTILIPGRELSHTIDHERVKKQIRIPNSVLCSTDYVCRIVTNCWRSNNSTAWNNVQILKNGEIVRRNQRPWIIRSRAEQKLNSLHINDTHIVCGYGNDGPKGREWWIQPKYKGFISSDYVLNGNNLPLDEFHPYSIEVMFDGISNTSIELIEWEFREFRNHWNYKMNRENDCLVLGFKNELNYLNFVNFVVCR